MITFPIQKINKHTYLLSYGLVVNIIAATSALAQVSPDNTLKKPTQVEQQGNQIIIRGGETAGHNLFLFHSFQEFSIPNNFEAHFNNASNIDNIISRVTGSALSNIEGTIRANGSANFILINPNGIRFGPNAQIKIGGSFLASTAESLTFADGVQFSASNSQSSSLLTMSVPVGLQFGSNPGTIVNRAENLNINSGNTFALIGGHINLRGTNIKVEQGRVELGSVGDNSLVQLTTTALGFELGYQGVENFQNISLADGTTIQGNNSAFQLQGRHIRFNQAQINSTTTGSQAAGNLTVNASESIEIIGSRSSNLNNIGLLANVDQRATGKGGDIIVNTRKLVMRDGAAISAGSLGDGDGGRLEINASESIQLFGTGFFNPSILATNTQSLTDSSSLGDGGEIIVNTKRLTLQDGAQIEAFSLSEGMGGTITINATESIQVSGSGRVESIGQSVPSRITAETGFQDRRIPGTAPGGNLSINTNQLIVTDGGIVSAGSLGSGNAGNLKINANTIFLDNQGILTASSEGSGDAGNLTIKTEQLTLNNQSEVAVRSIGTGQGGNLTVNAQSIALDNNSQLTATSDLLSPETANELGIDLDLDLPPANAGNLTLSTDELTIDNHSEVTVSSLGLGNAGDIKVYAQNIFLDNDSRLAAETASGEGGNITIDVNQVLTLRHFSQISTTAGTQGGRGNGGNLALNAKFIIAVPTENSDIIANAFLGNGGNITIEAAGVFGIEERPQLTPLSDITASSQFGQVGNIGINRPDVDPQRSLVKLPAEVVDANNLIIDVCRPGGAFTRGEFTINGRRGLPPNPNERVDTSTGLTELGYPNTDLSNSEGFPEDSQKTPSDSRFLQQRETATPIIVEAQGWIVNAEGNVVLTTQAPAVTPHSSGIRPATCYDFSKLTLSP